MCACDKTSNLNAMYHRFCHMSCNDYCVRRWARFHYFLHSPVMACRSDGSGTEMEIARAGDRILVRRRSRRRLLHYRPRWRDPVAVRRQLGRAHDGTSVTNEQLVCRLLLEKKHLDTTHT